MDGGWIEVGWMDLGVLSFEFGGRLDYIAGIPDFSPAIFRDKPNPYKRIEGFGFVGQRSKICQPSKCRCSLSVILDKFSRRLSSEL